MLAYEGELASMRALTRDAGRQLALWWKAPPIIRSDSIISAAFGDPDTNPKIERAAVNRVTAQYENNGWHVRSRERERIGFDLECTRGKRTEYVEVKGRQSNVEQVIMTHGELREAARRRGYVLCIVTSALDRPTVHTYKGSELRARFDMRPLAHQLTLKPRGTPS